MFQNRLSNMRTPPRALYKLHRTAAFRSSERKGHPCESTLTPRTLVFLATAFGPNNNHFHLIYMETSTCQLVPTATRLTTECPLSN